MYDCNFFKYSVKLKTQGLGTYRITHIIDVDIVKLQRLDGMYVASMVNDSHLKPYYDGHNLPG